MLSRRFDLVLIMMIWAHTIGVAQTINGLAQAKWSEIFPNAVERAGTDKHFYEYNRDLIASAIKTADIDTMSRFCAIRCDGLSLSIIVENLKESRYDIYNFDNYFYLNRKPEYQKFSHPLNKSDYWSRLLDTLIQNLISINDYSIDIDRIVTNSKKVYWSKVPQQVAYYMTYDPNKNLIFEIDENKEWFNGLSFYQYPAYTTLYGLFLKRVYILSCTNNAV